MLELSQRTDGADEILHKMKVSPEDVLLFARADLNAHYDEREIVLAATKDTLLISDGDRVQTYALKDLQNPAIEEKIGTCVFIGEYQGKRKLLATLTNSRKQECRLFQYKDQRGRCDDAEHNHRRQNHNRSNNKTQNCNTV